MSDIVKTRFQLIAAKATLMAEKGRYWSSDIHQAIREIQEQLNELETEARNRDPSDR
jgi:hypothetical protein